MSSQNVENALFDVISNTSIGYFPDEDLAIFFNGDVKESKTVQLPPGDWIVLFDEKNFDLGGLKTVNKELILPILSGIVLKRLP